MNASFGLTHLWTAGDPITRTLVMLLLGMSVLSWSILLRQALDLRQHWRRMAQSGAPTPLAQAVDHVLQQHRQWPASVAAAPDPNPWLSRALAHALQQESTQLHRGLTMLGSVGATAPFVGLLGTVWGIYHALLSMATLPGNPLQALIGPIGETLAMTALGLAVAIPAVLGYNALVRQHRLLMQHWQGQAHALHAQALIELAHGQATAAVHHGL